MQLSHAIKCFLGPLLSFYVRIKSKVEYILTDLAKVEKKQGYFGMLPPVK